MEQIVATGAAAGALIAILALLAITIKGFAYVVRAHDELLGSADRPSVRDLVEVLDTDLRSHMRDEDNTIAILRGDMDRRTVERDGQWVRLTARLDELCSLIRRQS